MLGKVNGFYGKWYSVVNGISSMINVVMCNPTVNGILEKGFTVKTIW